MFSDNCNLCKKLSEFDIDHIFHIAITSSNVKHYELTVTLRIIIEVTHFTEYIILFFELIEHTISHSTSGIYSSDHR